MRKLLFVLLFPVIFVSAVVALYVGFGQWEKPSAPDLMMCNGDYALCAASVFYAHRQDDNGQRQGLC
jgi:hypothetical protein